MYKPASFTYPLEEQKDFYRKWVENIPSEKIRAFIKIQLLCGYRGGEILNSYLFYADKLYIRAIASKSQKIISISNHGKENSRYLGHEKLLSLISMPVWKMSECRNLFNLDISELSVFWEENTYEKPKYFVADLLRFKTLMPIYKFLKNETLFVAFKGGELEEAFKDEKRVGIHFFRKLFASELYIQLNKDLLKTRELMKWKNLEILSTYIKGY